MKHNGTKTLTAGALVLAAITTVYGQDKAAAPPAALAPVPSTPAWLQDTFDSKLPEVIAKGKFNLNARLRYEYADAQTLAPSHAPTLRTRFGYTTAPLHGFKGMIEGENVLALGDRDNYNAAGTSGAGKTVVADPEATQLNQAWVSYTGYETTVKGGRQRWVLDNHRFIGDVGWRQNQQTFDAVTVESKYLKDWTVNYGYLWEINRIFGDDPRLAAGARDFSSDSHVFNVSYAGVPYGKVTAYAYLLQFQNSAVNSGATFGLSYAGAYPINKEDNLAVSYRGEYARQLSHRNQPVASDTTYWNLEGGATYSRFNFGGGYEVLGSDSGVKGFATPLATLHAFNGWADVFLATPATGLRDAYVYVGAKLPGDVPVKVYYHKFDADFGGADFGHEWDVVASKALGKHWTALAKYAYYDGKGPAAPFVDTQKLWLQVEFNY